ncbi:hypothetical protein ECZC10_52390 [Escherichia coli]|nr:hypothetical protein ECZC10_52390 [Escherichia coli]
MLRKGFTIAGCGTIAMGQRKPEDARNEERIARYEHNILRVVRQLKYCPTREWEIDFGVLYQRSTRCHRRAKNRFYPVARIGDCAVQRGSSAR